MAHIPACDPEKLPRDRPVAFDFETRDDGTADILALAWNGPSGESSTVYDTEEIHSNLPGLFKFLDESTSLIAHNMMFDLGVWERLGYDITGVRDRAEDTMILAYVRDTEASRGLKSLAYEFLGVRMVEWDVASTLSREEYLSYCRDDALMCLRLYARLREVAERQKLFPVYYLEREILWVVRSMTSYGVLVDSDRITSLTEEFDAQLESIGMELFTLAGMPLNLASPLELRNLYYNKWGVVARNFTLKKHVPSTDAAAIAEIASRLDVPVHVREFSKRLLDYRAYYKLRTAFLSKKFLNFIGPDGRVHPLYNTIQARTGRFSSREPNIQQVPKQGTGRVFRELFVASEGSSLIRIDYSQIELRLLAHFSQDAGLLQAYRTGADIHQTMATALGCSRDHAKTINFGVIYGMGVGKFTASTGLPPARATRIFEQYFASYPGIKEFKTSVSNYARRHFKIHTMSGRIRNLTSYARGSDGSLERLAVNTVVQGSAADLIKLAMVKCDLEFSGTPVRMLLQVHDELVFECPDDILDDTAAKIQDILNNIHEFSVPIESSLGFGRSWRDAA